MFVVKPLARKSSPSFVVKPLVKKSLTPTQDRASFITMLCQQGKTYAEAIRSWDRRAKHA